MRWIPRARPKIDCIACPWLVARFIDDSPEYLFVPPEGVLRVAKETPAIPNDVPGVNPSHVLKHGMVMYDALYAWCVHCQSEPHGWPPKS